MADMVRPLASTANFESKRDRKAHRKALVRERGRLVGQVVDAIAERRIEHQRRAAFWRDLRNKKIRRRRIAAEMSRLADCVSHLRREVIRLGDRVPGIDSGYLNEAVGLVNRANAATETGAAEWYAFSRRRIVYGTVE